MRMQVIRLMIYSPMEVEEMDELETKLAKFLTDEGLTGAWTSSRTLNEGIFPCEEE